MTDAITRGRQYTAEVVDIKQRAKSLRDDYVINPHMSSLDYALLCRFADKQEAKELRDAEAQYRRDLRTVSRAINIRTEEQLPGCWVAVDVDSYDGPEAPIGTGFSEEEAIDDLIEKLPDEATADLFFSAAE